MQKKKPEGPAMDPLLKKIMDQRQQNSESRIEKLLNREARAHNPKKFTGEPPHVHYKTSKAYSNQVDAYFKLRELDHKPMTVPDLALFVGCRTKTLTDYDPGVAFKEYLQITQYAIQKCETYIASELCRGDGGSTKGKEFLASNTLGYANKSEVKGQQSLEVTEMQRVRNMDDEEVIDQLLQIVDNVTILIPNKKPPRLIG